MKLGNKAVSGAAKNGPRRLGAKGAVFVVTGVLVLGGGGVAFATQLASGPVDGSGVIHGCYTSAAIAGSHVFLLQDAGTNCPKGTTAISWNQTGPQGPVGPTGAAGTPGTPGSQGPAGVSYGLTGYGQTQMFLSVKTVETVMSSAAAQQAGDYYVAATVEVTVGGNAVCDLAGSNEPTSIDVGPAAAGDQDISITGDVTLDAGDQVSIECAGVDSTFVGGSLTAILINSSDTGPGVGGYNVNNNPSS
jgi:hypothetical protein